eukprot:8778331-Alexandrium_andersonii.AAC.1
MCPSGGGAPPDPPARHPACFGRGFGICAKKRQNSPLQSFGDHVLGCFRRRAVQTSNASSDAHI